MDKIVVSVTMNRIMSWTCMSVDGKNVQSRLDNSGGNELVLSNLESGMYLIQLRLEGTQNPCLLKIVVP